MAGMDIRVEIDEKQLQYVIKKLEAAKVNVPVALRNVLNRVARDARKQMVQRARAAYTFKPGFKLGNIRLTPASAGRLSAKLDAKNRPRTAKRYNMRPTKRGVKLSVFKGRAPILLGSPGRRAWVSSVQGDESGVGLVLQRTGKFDPATGKEKLHSAHGPSEANMYKQAWEGARGGGPMQGLVESRLARELYIELDKHL